jgi:hypothetical protein
MKRSEVRCGPKLSIIEFGGITNLDTFALFGYSDGFTTDMNNLVDERQ